MIEYGWAERAACKPAAETATMIIAFDMRPITVSGINKLQATQPDAPQF
jgi:hypothetical protein